MKITKKIQEEYKKAQPFPHIIIKDFFDEKQLDTVLTEFPDIATRSDKQVNVHSHSRKLASKGRSMFGQATDKLINKLHSPPFLKWLQDLTGIKQELIADDELFGGGYHEIKRGGYLDVHVDFNVHPVTGLKRMVNVLIYLNKDWKEEYEGHLELWNEDRTECVRVAPEFNTMVIFTSTDNSWHGHPVPLKCPETKSRKSIALYYYSQGKTKIAHSTIYR